MLVVTESAKMEWAAKSTPRKGTNRWKQLAKGGAPGSPWNFEFNLYQFEAGYETPRHRHNFEQMRFALTGNMTYAPKKVMSPGSLTYFPEAAYYGPQVAPDTSNILVLQYGGASGQGYISLEQMMEARAELANTGTFDGGIYKYTDAEGRSHNLDGYEACWQHIKGEPVKFVKPRITEPVKFELAAHEWTESDLTGLQERFLASLTERHTTARVVRAASDTTVVFEPDQRVLLFTLAGDMTVDGATCGPETALFSEGQRTEIAAHAGWESLMITLPSTT